MSVTPVNQYLIGSVIKVRFYFATRTLSPQELIAYQGAAGVAPGNLPAGVGVDQTNVYFDYSVNGGTVTTLSGGNIVHEATGQYYATVTGIVAGTYKCRGYSKDGSNNPVATTVQDVFEVVSFPS